MTDRLRVGVIGAGHFGRFHILKVAASERAALAGIADPNAARAGEVAAEVGTQVLPVAELIAVSDAIIIAAPAEAHFPLARQAMLEGKHVLIEKPIAATLEEARELARLASEKALVLQVGHLERFSSAFAAVSANMGRPLYIEATRIAPFKPRGTDVSVILDIMIHDLDLVLALLDAPLESVDAVGAAVASEHEDIASARLHFATGAVATLTASRIAMKTERKMRVFAQDSFLSVDFANRKLFQVARGEGTPIPTNPGFGLREFSWTDHDNLAAEHAAFIASVADGAPVLVDAAAGTRALSAALDVARSMQQRRARMIASGLLRL